MDGLRYRVLGPVEVLRGEDPVRVPPGHQRAVLACLLAHAGLTVEADVLIEAAWPDALPASPRGALHTVVSRLRTVLGDGQLRSEAGGYRLCPAPGAVDAGLLEQLREEAGTAGPARAAELLGTARALWRGPAFGDLAELGVLTQEATRLDRLRSDVAEELAAALRACGRPAEAVAVLEELLAEDPFRERAVELLMGALHDAGRPSAGLDRFRSYRDLLADELGLDPGPALLAQQQRILGREGGETSTADPRTRSGAGAPPSVPRLAVVPSWADASISFVGRQEELAALLRRVEAGPVVTVVGPGGVGKTRLVAEALPELVRRHGETVVVELATTVPGRAVQEVARALGLRGAGPSLQQEVVDLLGAFPGLLVLDNCEQVREEIAGLVEDVAGHCPGVRVLATGRHRLDLPAEQVLQLEAFATPTARDQDDPALRLFAERVARVRPGAADRDGAAARRVCRLMDGLPLALELAAARSATIGTEAVAELLTRHGGLALPELAAVVDWSARLLTISQRELLCRLTVFAGPFDQHAAQAIAGPAETAPRPGGVLADLAELVDAHLVVRRDDGRSPAADDGSRRHGDFGMLALVRSRAGQLLEDSGDAEAAHGAHARWIAERLRTGARDWNGGGTAAASRRLTALAPDVAAALRWTLRTDHLDRAAAVTVPLKLHLHWVSDVDLSDLVIEVARQCAAQPGEGREAAIAAGALACAERGMTALAEQLGDQALDRGLPPEGQALVGIALAVAHLYRGELDAAARWARSVTDGHGIEAGPRADAGATLALALAYSGALKEARDVLRPALLGAQACGAEAAHAFLLYALGELAVAEEPRRAAALLRDAAARAAAVDAQHIAQVARLALFAVLVRTREHAEAVDLAGPLLRDIRRAAAWPQAWTTVRLVAELLLERHRFAEAALLLGAADQAREAPPLIAADAARGLDRRLREALGEDTTRGIDRVAGGLTRTQVLDRTAALITEERQAP